jgi:energy-coupling factor transporter ATP-binding protein EcfA2
MMNKNPSKLTFLFFLSFLLFLNSQAQNKKVTGTVNDNSGAVLPNVSVQVKGTNLGTLTDANGGFSISVTPGKSRLVFSFAGMVTQEITVNNQSTINVQLQNANNSLGEVVVIGYGTAKRCNRRCYNYQGGGFNGQTRTKHITGA